MIESIPANRGPQQLCHQRVIVQGRVHPFRQDTVFTTIPAGLAVSECLCTAGLPAKYHPWTEVELNAIPLPASAWSRTRPRPGVWLTFRPLPPTGQGLLRPLLMLVVAAAALVTTVLTAGALGPVWAAVLGAAIATAGGLLVNALVPIGVPRLSLNSASNPAVSGGGHAAASPTYSLTTAQNNLFPWGPIATLWGRHRIYPAFGARPYTEIVGDDQYQRLLYIWGPGPILVFDLKLAETPLQNFAGVEIEHRMGEPGEPPITLFPGQVFEEAFSVQLTQAGGFHTRTSALNIDEFSIDLTFPSLAQIGTNGQLLTASVNLEADYRRVGDPDWLPLISPSVEVFIEPQTFFPTSAWETGPSGDPASYGGRIWLNKDTVRLEMVFAPIENVGGEAFPAVPAHARSIVRFRVTADNLTQFTMELDPALTGFNSTNPVDRQIHVEGGTFFSAEATFSAAQRSTLRRSIVRRVATRGQYEIRVRRVTVDNTSTLILDESFWTVLRGFRHDPPITHGKPLAMTAVRIKASEQLNNIIQDFNGIGISILPDWDSGTETWITRATQNPAAIMRAVLQGVSSPRPLSDSQLDLPSFQTFAEYCITKGFACNMVRDFRASWWEAIIDATSTGRGTFILNNEGKWAIVVDELAAALPVQQHFTPRNSWGFASHKEMFERPHGWRMRFLNEEEGFHQDERLVFRDGYDETNATLYEELEVPGITDPNTLWRHGRFFHAEADLRPELSSLYADLEHLLCERGGRIQVSHHVLRVGLQYPRVTGVSGAVVSLDEPVIMQSGENYGIRFRLADGTSVVRTVQTVAGVSHEVILTGSGGVPTVGDLAMFGVAGLESARYVVQMIEPSSEWAARIYFQDESPAIHAADSGPIPPWDPKITTPITLRDLRPLPPTVQSITSGQIAAIRDEQGRFIRGILVNLIPTEPQPIPTARWRVRIRDVLTFRSTTIDYSVHDEIRIGPVAPDATYELLFWAISPYGVQSAPPVQAFHTIEPLQELVPGAVTTLAVSGLMQAILITWTGMSKDFLLGHELHYSISPAFGTGTTIATGPERQFYLPAAPNIPVYVWVRQQNTLGIFGPWSPAETDPGLSAIGGGLRGGNWIYNSDFEAGDQGYYKGQGWLILDIGPPNALSGTWVGFHNPVAGNHALIVFENFPVSEGDPVTLRAWGTASTVPSPDGAMYLVLAWADSQNVEFAYVFSPAWTAAHTAWAPQVISTTAPAGAYYVHAFVVTEAHATTGNFAVDNFFLMVGAVPTDDQLYTYALGS